MSIEGFGHRSRRSPALLTACLAAVLMQWGCAAHRAERQVEAEAETLGSVIDATPGARGNPPFYEVFGRRYHVLRSSSGYRERGVASWYGKDFHGLSTAGGEPYDMHALTAAHKTLPIPTWVEVTHLGNGKRVIVKINDRGPFVDHRIIDLSYRAAAALDMLRSGTARVEVRALGAPAGAAPREVLAQNDPPAGGGFSLIREAVADTARPNDRPLQQMFVQVGAFSSRDNAVRLVGRLKARGYADAFMVSEGRGSRALHRVRIGPLADVHQFDQVTRGLRALGLDESHLVVER